MTFDKTTAYWTDYAVCGNCGICAVCDPVRPRQRFPESEATKMRRERQRIAETLRDRGVGVRATARQMGLPQSEVLDLLKLAPPPGQTTAAGKCQCGPRGKMAGSTCARCGAAIHIYQGVKPYESGRRSGQGQS